MIDPFLIALTASSVLSALLTAGKIAFHLVVIGWVLLRRPRFQSSTLSWVIVIVAWPYFGALIYLSFGEVRLGRRRRRQYEEIQNRVRKTSAKAWSAVPYPKLAPHYQPIATLAESVAETVPRSGNRAELIGNSDEVIDRIVEDIDAATEHCHLLFYIFLADDTGRKVGGALERAVKRGVPCRLLVDGVGSRDFLSSGLMTGLRAAGVKVTEALPANLLRAMFARLDLRNHRKLVIVDGRVGYTGSQNVADANYMSNEESAPFVDVMMRITGPVVRDLHEIFVVDWFLDADEPLEGLLDVPNDAIPDGVPIQVLGTGPGSVNEAMVQIILSSLLMAREEIIMSTPYFIPDQATFSALITAARRGIETILILPARSDRPLVHVASRSYFQGLLEAGVQIFQFTEGTLHSKTITVDRTLALVSTANLDRRSFELNFEVSTLVYDSDFASQLRLLQKGYLDDSKPIDPHAWKRRGWTRRIVESLAGTLSPLM